MSEIESKLQGEMTERSANSVRLFEEAKRIQQGVIHLPHLNRQSAMNRVTALQREAVRESEICLVLEKYLSHIERE